MILRPKTPRLAWLVVPLAAVLSATAGSAQQTVPFRGSNPVAPQGIPAVPLPDTPIIYDTAEGQRIRVVVVARELSNPWSLAFLPDGSMLLTERPGRLRLIRNGVLDPKPIVDGVPTVRAGSFSGLMDVVLHPRFAENQFVYLSYNKPVNEKQVTLGLARGRWNGHALTDVKDIFVAGPGTSDASRLAFGRDGTLFMSTGGGSNGAQNPATHGGKVLRLNDDGSVPADNPFVGRADHAPEVYSLGHRNSLGLAIHPGTGDLWQHEQGPNGGDEMNVIRPGANYGWPLVSYGRTYAGPWQSEQFWRAGFEQPVVLWVPSIALSGLAFYTGDRLPKWKGDVFVGGLRTGEIPGTGHLERILFNEKMEELRRESLLVDLRQRIRDVRQGPDGLLYVLTDHNTDGAVLRIEPAP
jgi:glucose/arabinose dehydrogenase